LALSPKNDVISIIICTKNRKNHLRQCFDSVLCALEYNIKGDYEVIVVDGRSTDGTKELVEEYARKHASIRYVAQRGYGLPNARNYGLEFARGTVIVFLDDDVILEFRYFEKLSQSLRLHNLGGISGVYQIRIDTNLSHNFQTIKAALDRIFVGGWIGESAPIGKVLSNGSSTCNFEYARVITDVDKLTGCNMVFPRRILDKCGRFDETYDGNIGEDTDFSFRVKKLGYRLIIDPNLQLIHEDAEDRMFPYSEQCLYYSALNNVHFFFKNIHDGKLYNLYQFVKANSYFSVLYLIGGLAWGQPVLGTRYILGVLRGIKRKRVLAAN
jgi:glycosyltransferase involved in cell wall biosynthesis